MVEASETRMAIEAEKEETPFSIRISEPGPWRAMDGPPPR